MDRFSFCKREWFWYINFLNRFVNFVLFSLSCYYWLRLPVVFDETHKLFEKMSHRNIWISNCDIFIVFVNWNSYTSSLSILSYMIKPFFLIILVGSLLDLTENHSLTLMQPQRTHRDRQTVWDTSATIQTLTKILSTPNGSSDIQFIFYFFYFISHFFFFGISLKFLYAYITKIYMFVWNFLLLLIRFGGRWVLRSLNMFCSCVHMRGGKKEDRDGCRWEFFMCRN